MIRTPGSSKYHRLRTIRDMRDLYIYPQYFDAPVILDFRVAEKKNAKTSPGDYDCGQLVLQFVVFRRLLAENRSEVFFRVHSFFLDIRETKYNTWQKNEQNTSVCNIPGIYIHVPVLQAAYIFSCLFETNTFNFQLNTWEISTPSEAFRTSRSFTDVFPSPRRYLPLF